jgi:hypothetical protein
VSTPEYNQSVFPVRLTEGEWANLYDMMASSGWDVFCRIRKAQAEAAADQYLGYASGPETDADRAILRAKYHVWREEIGLRDEVEAQNATFRE